MERQIESPSPVDQAYSRTIGARRAQHRFRSMTAMLRGIQNEPHGPETQVLPEYQIYDPSRYEDPTQSLEALVRNARAVEVLERVLIPASDRIRHRMVREFVEVATEHPRLQAERPLYQQLTELYTQGAVEELPYETRMEDLRIRNRRILEEERVEAERLEIERREARTFSWRGYTVANLETREKQALAKLAEAREQGTALEVDDIEEGVWGSRGYLSESTIKTLLREIRKKVASAEKPEDPTAPDLIIGTRPIEGSRRLAYVLETVAPEPVEAKPIPQVYSFFNHTDALTLHTAIASAAVRDAERSGQLGLLPETDAFIEALKAEAGEVSIPTKESELRAQASLILDRVRLLAKSDTRQELMAELTNQLGEALSGILTYLEGDERYTFERKFALTKYLLGTRTQGHPPHFRPDIKPATVRAPRESKAATTPRPPRVTQAQKRAAEAAAIAAEIARIEAAEKRAAEAAQDPEEKRLAAEAAERAAKEQEVTLTGPQEAMMVALFLLSNQGKEVSEEEGINAFTLKIPTDDLGIARGIAINLLEDSSYMSLFTPEFYRSAKRQTLDRIRRTVETRTLTIPPYSTPAMVLGNKLNQFLKSSENRVGLVQIANLALQELNENPEASRTKDLEQLELLRAAVEQIKARNLQADRESNQRAENSLEQELLSNRILTPTQLKALQTKDAIFSGRIATLVSRLAAQGIKTRNQKQRLLSYLGFDEDFVDECRKANFLNPRDYGFQLPGGTEVRYTDLVLMGYVNHFAGERDKQNETITPQSFREDQLEALKKVIDHFVSKSQDKGSQRR